jgi:hypothetical protein
MGAETKFYTDQVKVVIDEATDLLAEEIAFALEGQAKANIVANDQVDTGFMLNSVYAVTRKSSGYGQAQGEASARNPDAEMAPEVQLSGGAASAVVVGAEYAVHQENRKSFLYKAAETVARQAGGIAERVGREVLG